LGLGNGLRNRLVENADNLHVQRQLISSAYAMIAIPSVILISIFSVLPFYLDLPNLLKIESSVGQDMLGYALAWLGVSFGIQLLLKTVTYILLAKQEASVNSMLNFLVNGLLLVVFGFAAQGWFSFDFYDLAIVNSIIPVCVLVILSVFWFRFGDLSDMRPSLKLIKISQMKLLSSLGFRFLVIQISAVVLSFPASRAKTGASEKKSMSPQAPIGEAARNTYKSPDCVGDPIVKVCAAVEVGLYQLNETAKCTCAQKHR
jgi:hypothetical protein